MKKRSNYRHLLRDSLRVLRGQLGLRKNQTPIATDEVTERKSDIQLASPTCLDVGLVDAVRSGWFNQQTQELFTGFPIESSDRVIDVGCGLGGNLKFCAHRAAHAIGIDIDPSRVQHTANLLKEAGIKSFDVIESNGDPLPVSSGSIDKIICTEVLEHVNDPKLYMKELVRIGKPGAQYLISVPGQLSEIVLKSVAPPEWFQSPNHIRVFSQDSFKQLIEDAGLLVEQQSFVGFFWSIWHAIACKCGDEIVLNGEINHQGKHAALDNWTATWHEVLALKEANICIDALDRVLHKSQIIIARKPS